LTSEAPDHLPGRALLPDILAPGLDVVFVGAAPSMAAAMSGHYYDGPRNRFWLLLHQAGFTPQRLEPVQDRSILQYRIGLTAVFPSLISTANSLLPEPGPDHLRDLCAKLMDAAPLVVCYNGKDVCRMCTGETRPDWGTMPERFGSSVQFVVPSSSGRADRLGADRLLLYRDLRELVDRIRSASPR